MDGNGLYSLSGDGENSRSKRKYIEMMDSNEEKAAYIRREAPSKRLFLAESDGPNLNPEETSSKKPLSRLCQFFYFDRCLSVEKCPYMHSEFPCKFYYFGLECRDGERCKFKHGPALKDDMKKVLWDHVTTAPSMFLHGFPCFPHALLKKHLEERHDELMGMEPKEQFQAEDYEQYYEHHIESYSSTLLGEVIKTVARNQPLRKQFKRTSKLVEIMSPDQVSTVAKLGVTTLDHLFKLEASTLLSLGFDFEELVRIEILKENSRKQSIYTANEPPVEEKIDEDTLEIDSKEVTNGKPALGDHELLGALDDEFKQSSVGDKFETNESESPGQQNDENSNSQLSVKEKENNFGRPSFENPFLQHIREDNDTPSTVSANRSSTGECDSKPPCRMPFKSIINQYTPAKEIDGSKVKYPCVPYRLIPIDIPDPDFTSVQNSFPTKPTYSLDPRIRLIFDIGTHFVHNTNNSVVRDPRLKRQMQNSPQIDTDGKMTDVNRNNDN
ncbi:uncharacterized protein LOC129773610 [Toxorhynchites rutilus septentrionalis]|uniref:uncharacterized protein LOC129773610 n=1 Tax=Toxorhynchites rutilus septentrionalis TaxID=329112 RepID=UPI00247A82D2|nr:uncharacterized protein LOC129773610 [Toxorhynchites rutilus septentrionalis]